MRKSKSAERVERLIKTAGNGKIEWKEKEPSTRGNVVSSSNNQQEETPRPSSATTPILRKTPAFIPSSGRTENEKNVVQSPSASRRARRRREERDFTHIEVLNSININAADNNNNENHEKEKSKDMPKLVVKIGLERFAGTGIIPGTRRTTARRVRNRGQSYHEKIGILSAFGEGVIRTGDTLAQPKDSFDVLFILQNKASEEADWSLFKNGQNKKVLFVNRDIFSFYNRTNHAYQITIKKYPDDPNSIISDYKYTKPTPEKLSKFLGTHPDFMITRTPKLGKEILICLNASKGSGRDGSDPISWATSVVSRLKAVTDCSIRIRPHPRDTQLIPFFIRCYKNDRKILFSDPSSETLHQFLDRGMAAIVYNSTISVPCVMKGIPIFIEGTNNLALPMNIGAIDRIADSQYQHTLDQHYSFERRQEFIYSLVPSVWTLDEMKRGEAWRHYKKELYKND